jgi:hypothetical protein
MPDNVFVAATVARVVRGFLRGRLCSRFLSGFSLRSQRLNGERVLACSGLPRETMSLPLGRVILGTFAGE